MKGYMYILECANGCYYTGSTNDLERRLEQHQNGEGANFTKKHLPVKLVYFEEYQRIDEAFYREKQVQGWSRKKKEVLINRTPEKLHELSECMNESHYKKVVSATLNDRTGNSPVAERSRSDEANVPFGLLRLRSVTNAQGTENTVAERSRSDETKGGNK